jgi:plastocyanin
MKRLFPIFIIGGILIAGGLVYLATRYVAHDYLTSQHSYSDAASIVGCPQKGTAHRVVIQHNIMQPAHTQALTCDTLTITNTDNVTRLIAFGVHDHHMQYDGVEEQQLTHGESFTVTLNRPGTYTFHDHLNDATHGDFTVTAP